MKICNMSRVKLNDTSLRNYTFEKVDLGSSDFSIFKLAMTKLSQSSLLSIGVRNVKIKSVESKEGF